MKKVLTLIFIFLAYCSFAQQSDFKRINWKRGCLAFSAGGVFPVGAFAGAQSSVQSAGYAKLGGFADLSLNFDLYDRLGIIALFREQINSSNSKAYTDQLNKTAGSSLYSVSLQDWNIQSLLAGFCYTIPIQKHRSHTRRKEKFSILPKLMAGAINVSYPKIKQTVVASGQTTTNQYRSTTAFCYLVGLTGKYNVNSNLCLLLNLDYTNANPTFKGATVTNNSGASISNSTQIAVNIHSLNASLGVGLRF